MKVLKCKRCGEELMLNLICRNCETPVSYKDFLDLCMFPLEIDLNYQNPQEGYFRCAKCGMYGGQKVKNGGTLCVACGYKDENEYQRLISIAYRFLKMTK
ncbi:MAG: hypothetical protein IIX01_02625 [Clostridia bacterium]|nr:hypothetical protein [Clostridia bacterium]